MQGQYYNVYIIYIVRNRPLSLPYFLILFLGNRSWRLCCPKTWYQQGRKYDTGEKQTAHNSV